MKILKINIVSEEIKFSIIKICDVVVWFFFNFFSVLD